MKKTVKVLAFALAAMALTVACNNNAPEEVIDTTPIDTVVEEVIDTTPVVEEPVVEEPVKATTTKKTATKKENKTEVKVDASKVSLNTQKGTTIAVSKDGVKVNKDGESSKIDASGVTLSGSKGSIQTNNEGSVKIAIKK